MGYGGAATAIYRPATLIAALRYTVWVIHVASSWRRVAAVSLLATRILLAQSVPAVDFQRDVRPILAENCFPYHGPDAPPQRERSRNGGFRGAGSGSVWLFENPLIHAQMETYGALPPPRVCRALR
jgi:hypothetical protein